MKFNKEDKVLVYKKWQGIIQGTYNSVYYIVSYNKNGSNIIDYVSRSNLKKSNRD